MSVIKRILKVSTGYWLHKISDLPVGADLFIDISKKLKYNTLDVVFDVGANVGQTYKWFRSKYSKATIFCFEPVQSTFQELLKVSGRDANFFPKQLALGDASGQMKIRLFGEEMNVLNSLKENVMNKVSDAKEEVIQMDTIDNFCESNRVKKIDLLKIDTEGYELNVLRGAHQMMQRAAIPLIYCETGFQRSNQRNTQFDELTDFLETKDYYFFGLYQVDYHDWKRGNHLANALYVHQSIFP